MSLVKTIKADRLTVKIYDSRKAMGDAAAADVAAKIKEIANEKGKQNTYRGQIHLVGTGNIQYHGTNGRYDHGITSQNRAAQISNILSFHKLDLKNKLVFSLSVVIHTSNYITYRRFGSMKTCEMSFGFHCYMQFATLVSSFCYCKPVIILDKI
jgi:hypothetical protein